MENQYYAVIFTSTRTRGDNGYSEMAYEMEELAKRQPGFLGMEGARENIGFTISDWENLEAIANWKANSDHQIEQQTGITDWYSWYKVRIC